jgi:Insertion element 4 transposase N-terminal/Transposase DDE domain
MLTTIRQVVLDSKITHHVSLSMIESVIPPETVEQVLSECDAWEQREKKLNMRAIVYWLIALHVFATCSMPEVWRRLVDGWKAIWPSLWWDLPTAGALCQRRAQLGVTVMRTLFARCVHPLATAATKGAFRFNLRVVALDGTLDDLPDSDANRTVFPYNGGEGHGHSPFPQLRSVLLMECGTHAIFDAELLSTAVQEQQGALLVLARSLTAGMLLVWDRGFHTHELIALVRSKGAHLVGRLPSKCLRHVWARLSDGTYLTKVPRDGKHGTGYLVTVRVIEYTITDPQLPGYGQHFRLFTTLLDPKRYPAKDIIALYHERWEIECGIDEFRTHLRLSARTLRSQTPQGVEQEYYALLLAHFAVRVLMHLGALLVDEDPDRLSFTHTLMVLQRSVWHFALVTAEQVPALRAHLLAEICEVRVPPRRLRFQARVVKRTHAKFRRKCYADLRAPCVHQPFLDIVTLI